MGDANPGADEVLTFAITIDRSELIPGGSGARIGFSADFPDKQFLIIPVTHEADSKDSHVISVDDGA